MDDARIPLEVDAGIPPGAYEDLAGVLESLGYAPRRGGDGGTDGSPALDLKVGRTITPEAAQALMEGVSGWVRRRPAPKGRFRKRKAPPVVVTIIGTAGEVLSTTAVERG
jgi:hypothetical protein